MVDTPDSAEQPGLSRRTVLAGAAWSAPVIALAAAAPMAAASNEGLRVVFVAAGILKTDETILVGLVYIKNTSGVDLADQNVSISFRPTLTGNAVAPLSTTPVSDPTVELESGEVFEIDNSLFTASTVGDVTTILSGGSVPISATEDLIIAFYFEWPARNQIPGVFVVAGSFVIGTADGAIESA